MNGLEVTAYNLVTDVCAQLMNCVSDLFSYIFKLLNIIHLAGFFFLTLCMFSQFQVGYCWSNRSVGPG